MGHRKWPKNGLRGDECPPPKPRGFADGLALGMDVRVRQNGAREAFIGSLVDVRERENDDGSKEVVACYLARWIGDRQQRAWWPRSELAWDR